MTAWLFTASGGWRAGDYQCGICIEGKLYQRRNCSKHFPELVQIDRKPWWRPKFSLPTGKDKIQVDSFRLAECPVSEITGESMWLVEQLNAAESMQKAGVIMWGGAGKPAPAWWVDAVETVQKARAAVEESWTKQRGAN